MHKVDFERIRAVGSWVNFVKGDVICDTVSARESLFILVQGQVWSTYRYEEDSHTQPLPVRGGQKQYFSGDCFDYRALNAFGVFVGFPNEHFECHADGPGLAFRLPLRGLLRLMAAAPQVQPLMRVYALGVLARAVQNGVNELPRSFDSYGMPEDDEWLTDGARCRDFQPLQPDELVALQQTPRSVMAWVWGSIRPGVPSGCRHASNPLSGSMAQAHVETEAVTGLSQLRRRPTSNATALIVSSSRCLSSSSLDSA
jgi:hypothetical protein